MMVHILKMVVFKLIAAMCSDGGIGYKGQLPWPHCKADMAHFAKRTTGAGNNAVIMGKKTWDSIPARPLRNRANLILSSHPPETYETHQGQSSSEHWFKTVPDLFAHLEFAKYDEAWIIGGASIYEQFWRCTTGMKSSLMKCVSPRLNQYINATRFFPHYAHDRLDALVSGLIPVDDDADHVFLHFTFYIFTRND